MSDSDQQAAGELPFAFRAKALAEDANSALNGVADAVGLTEHVERSPYLSVAAAVGLGYVVGGGLFTGTTARLLRLGLKVAAVPMVQDQLLDLAETVIDQVLARAQAKPPEST